MWRSAIALIAALQVFGNANDSSLDTTVPTVAISSPSSSATFETTNSSVTVAGTSSDTNGIAICRIANALTGVSANAVTTAGGSFTLSVSLSTGANAITVTCLDPGGNQGTDLITVTRGTTSGGGIQIAGVQPNPSLAEMSIPEPTFGLNETVSNTYGSDTFATHWFDNTVTCTDTSNPSGTQASPRCTPPTMTALAAGSVVQGCGTYSRGGTDITITASGTVGSPVFFRRRTGCTTLRFNFTGSGNFNANSSSYLIIEGVVMQSVQGTTLQGANHLSYRDNEHIGSGSTADSGECIGVGSSTDIIRARNIIHDCGDWTAATENDSHCLAISSNITRVWDLWNTTYHCSGDGWGNGHDANHTTTFVYVGGNEFYENRENGLDLKEVNTGVISRNWCHDIATSSSSPGECFVIHYGPDTGFGGYNLWVLNNLCENAVTCLSYTGIQSGQSNYAIGNVFRDCDAAWSHNGTSSPGSTFVIRHNTFANCQYGTLLGTGVASGDVCGNIVREASGRHLAVETSGNVTNTQAFNELYYDNDGGIQIAWGGTGITYTSVAAWISGTSDGDNSLQTDPLFTNFPTGDYTLTASSAARSAGCDMSTLATTFTAAFGTSLRIDIAGTARPSGTTRWDMGAYQYVAP